MTRKESAAAKAAKCAAMKKLHGERRDENVCINNKTHGKAHKGGRCKPCWKAKLAAERSRYAKRKAEEGG